VSEKPQYRDEPSYQPVVIVPSSVGKTYSGGAEDFSAPTTQAYVEAAPAIKEIAPSRTSEAFAEDDIFDRDLFKKKKAVDKGDAKFSTASEVLQEFEDRYNETPVSPAAFFAPPELLDQSGSQSPRIDPNEDADVRVYQAHGIAPLGGTRAPPYPAPYSFKTSTYGPSFSDAAPSFPVPTLNLIQPTPEGSVAGSVRGVSVPPSPVIQPVAEEQEPLKKDIAEKPAIPKVTWGEDETFHYEDQTPESVRDAWVSNHAQPSYTDISTLEGADRVEPVKEYSPQTAESYGSKGIDKHTEADEEIRSPADNQAKEKREAKANSGVTVYQKPFYETVSDLGLKSSSRPRQEAPEGDARGESESVSRVSMPGGFDDELENVAYGASTPESDGSSSRDKNAKSKDRLEYQDLSLRESEAKPVAKPERKLSKKEQKKAKKAAAALAWQDDFDETTKSNEVETTRREPLQSTVGAGDFAALVSTIASRARPTESASEGGVGLESISSDPPSKVHPNATALDYYTSPSQFGSGLGNSGLQFKVDESGKADEWADSQKRSKKKKQKDSKAIGELESERNLQQTSWDQTPSELDRALSKSHRDAQNDFTVVSPVSTKKDLAFDRESIADSQNEFFSADSDRTVSPSEYRDSIKDEARRTSAVPTSPKLDDFDERDYKQYRDTDSRRSESRDRTYDQDAEPHKRRRRRRETDRSDDWDSRSTFSEATFDGEDTEKSSRHKRNGTENGSPERKVRSSGASDPGDTTAREHRASKRRHKHRSETFDDAASVASAPSRYDDASSRSSKDKEKRSSGIFGLFGGRKQPDTMSETSSKSKSKDAHRGEEYGDSERKHRRKKHRSSTYGSGDEEDDAASVKAGRDENADPERKHRKKKHRSSTYGSGEEDDDLASVKSGRSEKRSSRSGSKYDTGR
jgi:hypothetical protein